MINTLERHPVRKSRKQKQAFLAEVQDCVKRLGYVSTVEKGNFGSRNLIVGDPDGAEYLVTAHYDTCARLPFPNLITPCNFWAFLAYQLFTVMYMFVFVAVFGVIAMLLTKNEDLAFYVSYAALWLFLILMLAGPANKHNANDNSSGVLTVLEIAKALPEEYRRSVCFVLFDLEEAGLIGSASYYGKHKKAVKQQLVLNLDCVGDGDELMMFPTGKVKRDNKKIATLRSICGVHGDKTLSLKERGFSVYPSDQVNFPLGVGVAAFHKGRAGLYLSRIHTTKDTILEKENVNILRDSLIKLVTDSAVQ